MKAISKELSINIVKGFLKIKFERNIPFFPFGPPHKMNNFLQNNRVVRSAPTLQKTALVGTNNIIKDQPDTVDKDFCNDFLGYVAKADRPKVFVSFERVDFGDKSNEGVRYGGVEKTSVEG